MKFLASYRWCLFLTAWLLYSIHFATNVVREHYPAFSLVDHFTLKVDEYQGFHPDIFVHRDGHSYVGSNVAVSVFAAIPLFVFDPVLDLLERHRNNQLAALDAPPDATYRTRHANSRVFFKLIRERGLDLRFGGATVVTSVFFMAPISALSVVLMFHILVLRGVKKRSAVRLTLLFAFGTPMFFRTAPINPNMFMMHAVFLSFFLLWVRPDLQFPVSLRNRVGAGFLAGIALATDYGGVPLLLLLYGYLFLSRLSTASWQASFRESFAFVTGSIPPVLFLLYTQWAMYGNPFLPGQYWMPDVNYTDLGWRGFDWPSPDLLLLNLFHPSYGMYLYGPLLMIGLAPSIWYAKRELVFPRRERRFVAIMMLVLLIFYAVNQYSRMQFNSGFRYLVPLVPFIFLAATDHLIRMPRNWLIGVSGVALIHSWVLAAVREPPLDSWRIFLTEGIQLPWLTVLRQTSPIGAPIISSPLLPTVTLGTTLLVVAVLWWYGTRVRARSLSDTTS